MRYTYRKDKRNRIVFLNNEKCLRYKHILSKDQSVSAQYRFFLLNKRKWKSKGIYRGFTKNHCVLTFRCGGILSKFRLSRIKFREMANAGQLAGVRQASW